ncbi:hypothetical protein [Micromonospora sp. NPDC004704]
MTGSSRLAVDSGSGWLALARNGPPISSDAVRTATAATATARHCPGPRADGLMDPVISLPSEHKE